MFHLFRLVGKPIQVPHKKALQVISQLFLGTLGHIIRLFWSLGLLLLPCRPDLQAGRVVS